MKNRGIAFHFSLLVLSGSALVVGLVVVYNYYAARAIIVRQAEENARNLVSATVGRVDTVLRAAEKVAEGLAQVLGDANYSEEELLKLLATVAERNREVYGVAIAFEPHSVRPDDEFFAPYYYKSDGKLRFKYLGSEAYRYFLMDWYQIPRYTGAPIWTEPYFDEGGGQVVMSTYAVPFYRRVDGEPRFAGVIAANISLDWLKSVSGSVNLLDNGYAFLVSRNGMLVTHPDPRWVMNESIFSLAENRDDRELREIGRSMVRGESGSVQIGCLRRPGRCQLIYAPLPANGWSLAAVLPESELLGDVVTLNRTMFLIGAAGSLLLAIVVVSTARSLSRPLVALARASEDMAQGNLDVAIPQVSSQHEVGRLASAFARMQHDLKRYIGDLRATSAAREIATAEAAALNLEREAMRRELDIAAKIQQSILPRQFPPFPERRDIDIFAAMIPAREVGGDFYDFFLIDAQRLGFVIGDVSDKGVPAAIFMAVSRTLLKATALHGLPPGECLKRVNHLLCLDNSSQMFVTLFYGILNTATGALGYANAGHPAPFLLRRDGRVEALDPTGGVALGVVEGATYQARQTRLDLGDALLLFTDGVTEAMASDRSLFSERRLQHLLDGARGATAFDLIERVVSAVRSFAGNEPQSDDLTVMAVRCRPEAETADALVRLLHLRNETAELTRVREAVEELAIDAGLPSRITFALQLALEEALANVITYAYGDGDEHSIGLRLALRGREIVAEIEDDGQPFNPLERPPPDIEAPLEDRPVGGLGIHLVRTLMDDVAYERRGGKNVLVLRKSTEAAL